MALLIIGLPIGAGPLKAAEGNRVSLSGAQSYQ